MNSESSSVFFWTLFALQQLLVPLVSFTVAMPAMKIIGSNELGMPPIAGKLAEIVIDAAPAIVAVCLGRIAGSASSSVKESGKMIWLLPLLLLLLGIIETASRMGLGYGLKEFFSFRRGVPDSGLGIILFTYPALICCCYSIATALTARRGHKD